MHLRARDEGSSTRVEASPSPLDLVKLRALMERTRGLPTLRIALIDGPVAVDHPDLAAASIRGITDAGAACARGPNDACAHGTLVAGVLVASRIRRASHLPRLHAARSTDLFRECKLRR